MTLITVEQGVVTPCSDETVLCSAIYHITWVTYNSRVSQRMIDFKVKYNEPVWFDEQTEILITKIISEIVYEKKYMIYAYNICRDHIHMLIGCNIEEISNIIRLLKGKSAQRYKEIIGIPAHEKIHLWAQKFNKWLIKSEVQLYKTAEYIINNRKKHGLQDNKGLQPLVISMMQYCDKVEFIEDYAQKLS